MRWGGRAQARAKAPHKASPARGISRVHLPSHARNRAAVSLPSTHFSVVGTHAYKGSLASIVLTGPRRGIVSRERARRRWDLNPAPAIAARRAIVCGKVSRALAAPPPSAARTKWLNCRRGRRRRGNFASGAIVCERPERRPTKYRAKVAAARAGEAPGLELGSPLCRGDAHF